MKLLAILSLCLVLVIPAVAQVFPAATNANNTFYSNNTFTVDADIYTRFHGPNGGAGYDFHWFSDHLRLTNSVFLDWVDFNNGVRIGTGNNTERIVLDNPSGNIVLNNGAFYGNGTGITNLPVINTPTNSITQNINFGSVSYVEGVFQTNAAFAWLGYSGLANTIMQTAVIWLTNDTGSAIVFTAPANTHTTGILNVTNVTEIVVKRHPGWTNMFSLPLW